MPVKTKGCTYCKRRDGTHTATCPRSGNGSFACPSCDFTSGTVAGRNRHVNQQHGNGARPKAAKGDLKDRLRADLDAAKRRVQALEAELAAERARVAVLAGYVG